eukprot:JP447017.1.p3 GENE.JP447017.1~~JP447017.1.p3  ORF type:complete len:68 (+),score=21.17 JP447017.1:341-544(+)
MTLIEEPAESPMLETSAVEDQVVKATHMKDDKNQRLQEMSQILSKDGQKKAFEYWKTMDKTAEYETL